MKLSYTKGKYTGSNVDLTISDDMTHVRAHSWEWWRFVETDAAGNIIVNEAKYSVSTSRHQTDVFAKLRMLNIKPHLILECTRKSLECIRTAVENEIVRLKWSNEKIAAAMAKKGSHKRKNEERAETIKQNEYRIKDLQRYLDEYCDKKLLPQKKINVRIYTPLLETYKALSYRKYFLKPNGKLKNNEYHEFIRKITRVYLREADIHQTAPQSIDKILELLDLKSSNFEAVCNIISYIFAQDVNEGIPPIDSYKYIKLKKTIKKKLANHPVNEFLLEKIHTIQINWENNNTYTSPEPIALPVHEKLLELEKSVKELTVLKTVRDIRAEGRKQNHCIGQKEMGYIDRCLNGFQALNYKGYTFFLSPDLKVRCAYGKYNRHCPSEIKDEFTELIA